MSRSDVVMAMSKAFTMTLRALLISTCHFLRKGSGHSLHMPLPKHIQLQGRTSDESIGTGVGLERMGDY